MNIIYMRMCLDMYTFISDRDNVILATSPDPANSPL